MIRHPLCLEACPRWPQPPCCATIPPASAGLAYHLLRYWARFSRTHPEDGSGHEGSRRTGTCIGERGTRSLTVSLLTVPQPGHPASFLPGATPLPLASPPPHVHRTRLLFYGTVSRDRRNIEGEFEPFLYRPSTNLPHVCTGLVLIFTKFSSL